MTKKLAVRYRWEEDGSCRFFTPDGREVVQSACRDLQAQPKS
jgi:hypothetical protein